MSQNSHGVICDNCGKYVLPVVNQKVNHHSFVGGIVLHSHVECGDTPGFVKVRNRFNRVLNAGLRAKRIDKTSDLLAGILMRHLQKGVQK